MLLNQTVIYGLRAMSYLAYYEGKDPIRSQDLAKATCVPSHYLSKIMRRLTAAGIVSAQKGHHGGFQLARPSEKISFADIMNNLDFHFETDQCAFGWDECGTDQPCPLHPFWVDLKEKLQVWAEGSSLKDVVSQQDLPDFTGRCSRHGH